MSKQDVEEEVIEGSSSATLTDCYCKDIDTLGFSSMVFQDLSMVF